MRILTTLCLTLLLTSMVNAKIVFRSKRDGNYEIYVMDDDGSNLRRLTNNPLSDSGPRWSPDGKHIVFMRQVDIRDNQRSHLFIMNADGTNERQLTEPHPFVGADLDPVFSPDGKSILFYRLRGNEDDGLYVMDLESGVVKRISDRLMNDAEFTPDGRHITFSNVTVAQNADAANVFIMRADGKDVRPLLPRIPDGIHQTRRFASFSPNGKKILYAESTFENELKQLDNGGWAFFPIAYRTFICDSNGNNPSKLNIPTNWLKYSLVWMDNGKAALFSADKDFDIQQAWDDPERTFDIYRYDIVKRQITPLTTHPASDQAAHWISDDVLSVSPVGKQPVQWGELKTFVPAYRVVSKAVSASIKNLMEVRRFIKCRPLRSLACIF